MTLAITAVAPDVIVMGTDSSVSLKLPNAPTELVYRGLKRLLAWQPIGVGVCIFGTFPTHIGAETFSDWIQNWYCRNIGEKPIDPDNLAKLLCADFDRNIPVNYKNPVGLHLAQWVTSEHFPGTKIPIVIEINRTKGKYTYNGKVSVDILNHIHRYRMGDKESPYVAVFFAAGLPNLGAEEMASLRDLFSKIVGAPVPAGTSLHLNEYVRLLITTTAHLYSASGLPGYVSEPVETLYLPPATIYGVSMRY
jgi:hypothetical protein